MPGGRRRGVQNQLQTERIVGTRTPSEWRRRGVRNLLHTEGIVGTPTQQKGGGEAFGMYSRQKGSSGLKHHQNGVGPGGLVSVREDSTRS